jgi:hypothetical protein
MNQLNQLGGVKCSLCGSNGTNQTTCPLNKMQGNPNYTKHPNAMRLNVGLANNKTTDTVLTNVTVRLMLLFQQIILSCFRSN